LIIKSFILNIREEDKSLEGDVCPISPIVSSAISILVLPPALISRM